MTPIRPSASLVKKWPSSPIVRLGIGLGARRAPRPMRGGRGGLGASHFLMKRLKNVRTEMALSVLAYNLTRVMNIIGIGPLMAAIRA